MITELIRPVVEANSSVMLLVKGKIITQFLTSQCEVEEQKILMPRSEGLLQFSQVESREREEQLT